MVEGPLPAENFEALAGVAAEDAAQERLGFGSRPHRKGLGSSALDCARRPLVLEKTAWLADEGAAVSRRCCEVSPQRLF